MRATTMQTNFARGAVDAAVSGRIDLGLYQQSGQRCENFIPSLRGPIVYRSGTWHRETLMEEAALIPFAFNTEQQYVLMFANGVILFYVYDANGDLIPLLDGSSVHVTLVSPYTLQQSKELRWAQTLDVMYLVHPDVEPQKIQRTAADAFTIGTYTRTSDPFDDPSSGTVGWPRSVAFHEGRLVYGGSTLKPLTFWASRSTDFESHAVSAPVVATDAFTATVSVVSNPFEWVASAEDQILLGAGDGIVSVTGGDNGVTALQFKAEATATAGAAPVRPLRRDGVTFYLVQGAKNVRHFRFDLLSESYSAPETSLLARNLLSETIVQGVICDREDPLYLWLDATGVIHGHIFSAEENDLAGWFTWRVEGEVVSLCAHAGGRLALLIRRGTEYHLETLATDVRVPTQAEYFTGDVDADLQAFSWASKQIAATSTYLDGSVVAYDGSQTSTLTYDSGAGTMTDSGSGFVSGDVGRNIIFRGDRGYNVGVFRINAYNSASEVEVEVLLDPGVTTTDDWLLTTNTISGVTLWAGKEVSLTLDGIYYGEVTLDGSGDASIPVQAGRIVVGKKYLGAFQSNLLGLMGEAGANSWRGEKVISQFDVLAYGYGGQIGTSRYRLEPIQQWGEIVWNYAAAVPLSGYQRVPYADQAQINSTVWVGQDTPMPLSVAAWQAEGSHST